MQLERQDAERMALVALYEAAHAAKRRGQADMAAGLLRELLPRADALDGPDRAALGAATLHQLSDLAAGDLAEDELAFAEALAEETAAGGEAGWIVRFALAQARMGGDPAAAMAWLNDANAMRRAVIDYDAGSMDRVFAALAATFDGETIGRLSKTGGRSPKPVFVVGMPRSGTTLVEQVLASAPGVHGAGELTALADLARNIHGTEGGWPGGAARLSPRRVTQLATAYLVHIHGLAPKAERVVDKMPANAQNVGLILSLFPNATIIHTRRDPLDNCFGCYRQLFRGGVDYCYDQEELGRYHQGLMRLLDHWKAIAPGRIVEVDYRTLVEDFETEARRLVDAVGMPWSNACLAFHETEREVDTASSVQVRQPLFTSGIGSAGRFRPYLAPLEAALAA